MSKPILFGASWCSMCKPVKVKMDKAQIDYEYVDVDENEAVAIQYKVRSLPTLIKDGEVIVGQGNILNVVEQMMMGDC